MYNSYTVKILVGIWSQISHYYNYSVLKSILCKLTNKISLASSGSAVKRFITNKTSLIEESQVYRLYVFLLTIVEKLSNITRGLLHRFKAGSVVADTVSELTKGKVQIASTISIFALGFASTIIISRVLRGNIISKTNIISLALIAIAVVIINLGERLYEIIENSFVVNTIKDIFTIDDGGDQWW